MPIATLVAKSNAAFLSFFAAQMIFAPDLLLATNFQPGSYSLDKWHYWMMRGMGGACLGYAIMTLMVDAQKLMPLMTAINIGICSLLPWYAHAKLPIKLPEHYIPVVGTALLTAAQVYCVAMGGKSKGA